jgi:hypothetical protein
MERKLLPIDNVAVALPITIVQLQLLHRLESDRNFFAHLRLKNIDRWRCYAALLPNWVGAEKFAFCLQLFTSFVGDGDWFKKVLVYHMPYMYC